MVGKTTKWVDQAVEEYRKRLPNLDLERIAGNPVKSRMRRLASACGNTALRVYLDKSGRIFSSETLATLCLRWQNGGRDVCFVIGDDVGFSKEDLEKADLVWSLSPLTFPHHLVRVMVCEQLYRATSIISGHDYHRA